MDVCSDGPINPDKGFIQSPNYPTTPQINRDCTKKYAKSGLKLIKIWSVSFDVSGGLFSR